MDQPSLNGSNGGRDKSGRFAKGNTGGPGNPLSRRVNQLRAALIRAVTPKRMKAIVKKMIDLSEAGDVAAAKVVLAYCIGQPTAKIEATMTCEPTPVYVVHDRDWYGTGDKIAALEERNDNDSRNDSSPSSNGSNNGTNHEA